MKRIIRVSTFLLIFAGILAACQNPFMNMADLNGQFSSESTTHGVLNISMDRAGARAIMPDAPEFTNFRLSFEAQDGQSSVPDIESEDGIFKGMQLEEGDWQLHAYGYAHFDDEDHVIAEASLNVSISAGQGLNESMILRSFLEGDDGAFSYSIEFAAESGVHTYEIVLQAMDGTILYSAGNDNMESGVHSVSDITGLEPGYYLATARAWNIDSLAVKMTVLHIYSNRNTSWDIEFDVGDFFSLISLSGTAEVWVNGNAIPSEDIKIELFSDPQLRWNHFVGRTGLEEDSSEWLFQVGTHPEPAEYFFILSYYYEDSSYRSGILDSVHIHNSDIEDIQLIFEDDLIQISGTIELNLDVPDIDQFTSFHDFRLNTQEVIGPNNQMFGHSIKFDENGVGSWSVFMQVFDEPTTLYPILYIYYGPRYEYGSRQYDLSFAETIEVHQESIEDISLTGDFILKTVSGTAQVSIGDSSEIEDLTVWVYRDHDSISSYLDYADVDENGSWSVVLRSFEEPGQLGFSLAFRYEDAYYRVALQDDRDFHTDDVSDVELIYSGQIIDIGGSLIHDFTAEYLSVRELYIGAYTLVGNMEFELAIELIDSDGSWSFSVPQFDVETDVYFWVGVEHGYNFTMLDIEIPVTVHNEELLDIELNLETLFIDVTVETGDSGFDTSGYYLIVLEGGLFDDNVKVLDEVNSSDFLLVVSRWSEDRQYWIALDGFDQNGNEVVYFQEFYFGASDIESLILNIDDMTLYTSDVL